MEFRLIGVYDFALRHYLYEQQIARMTWKIDYKDLMMSTLESDTLQSDKTVPDDLILYTNLKDRLVCLVARYRPGCCQR